MDSFMLALQLAAAAAGVAAAVRRWQATRAAAEAEAAGKFDELELLHETEQLPMFDKLRVETATLLRPVPDAPADAPAPREQLVERLQKMLEANPWLLGEVLSVGGRMHLAWNRTVPADAADKLVASGPASPYVRRAVDSAEAALEADGDGQAFSLEVFRRECTRSVRALLGGKALPPFCVTLLDVSPADAPAAPAQRSYVANVSMCHSLGDAHTFYTLMRMLAGHPAEALDVRRPDAADVRKYDGERFCPQGPGWKGAGVVSIIGRAFAGLLIDAVVPLLRPVLGDHWDVRRGRGTAGLYAVNHAVVQEMKEAAKREGQWVSTNDVLTSWWWQQGPPCAAKMSLVNLRGRTDIHRAQMAGNYVCPLVVHESGDRSAAGLRRILLEGRNSHFAPPPSKWTSCVRGWQMVTNWSTFHTPLKLPTHKEVLNLPLLDMRQFGHGMVIFALREGQLGCQACGDLFWPSYSKQINAGEKWIFGKQVLDI